MSYDLMVFDPSAAPRDAAAFRQWYHRQTEWSEGPRYNDPAVTSPPLQAWFHEMRAFFPPLNGPFACRSEDPSVTDHCIGRYVIYSAFSLKTRELAAKHRVGFYDVSGEDGEIVFPPF